MASMEDTPEDYDKSVRAKFAYTDSIGDAIYLHAGKRPKTDLVI